MHSLVWLGLEWDLVAASFRVTQKRIEFFLDIIESFLGTAPYVTARNGATHILSMSPTVGPLTRLKTRYLYRVIEA